MQGSKLYVGNLNYAVTEDQLKELFSAYGEVKSVNLIEGKGFGFVEMSSPEEAEKAKEALNDKEYEGRNMRVDEARPATDKPPRRSFGGGGGRGGDRSSGGRRSFGGGGRRF
ncbi:MAG: RNA-binding protein [Candidatus Diapherotrites archaeon]|nr:RNA-binding protein [Candidatus Diapherotrites archaeon]